MERKWLTLTNIRSDCHIYKNTCASDASECSSHPPLKDLFTSAEAARAIFSICDEMPMNGCDKCKVSGPKAVYAKCDLYDVYDQLCADMPEMVRFSLKITDTTFWTINLIYFSLNRTNVLNGSIFAPRIQNWADAPPCRTNLTLMVALLLQFLGLRLQLRRYQLMQILPH